MSLWQRLLAREDGAWSADLAACFAEAQQRRQQSPVKVGSIDLMSMRLLRSLCVWLRPSIIVEVGTGLGASTFALQAQDALYTCDKNHDLVPSTDRVRTHPKTLATVMLQALVAAGRRVDLFFFDGRIHAADLPLIAQLATPTTAYVFDDYLRSERRQEKGMANVTLLQPTLSNYRLELPVVETWNPIAGLLPTEALS